MFHLLDGRDEVYQWDSNLKLVLDIEGISEVHFYNQTKSKALVVIPENNEAEIPNILLREPYDLSVCLCIESHTEIKKKIHLVTRPRPESYVFEDNVKYSIQQIVQDGINEGLRIAKESGEFDGYTPVKGIDYWTEGDQNEIKSWVESAILEGKW